MTEAVQSDQEVVTIESFVKKTDFGRYKGRYEYKSKNEDGKRVFVYVEEKVLETGGKYLLFGERTELSSLDKFHAVQHQDLSGELSGNKDHEEIEEAPICTKSNGSPRVSFDDDFELKLNMKNIRELLCPNATDEELKLFMVKCANLNLNPFLGEIYLIKYKDSPAQTVIAKDSFLKRAMAQPKFKEYRAGVIVARQKPDVKEIDLDTVEEREGSLYIPGEVLLGGWCTVYFNDQRDNFTTRVSIQEYDTSKSTWKKMPATMIRKTAIAQAMREAFPHAMSGQYIEEELGIGPVENISLESEYEIEDEVPTEEVS